MPLRSRLDVVITDAAGRPVTSRQALWFPRARDGPRYGLPWTFAQGTYRVEATAPNGWHVDEALDVLGSEERNTYVQLEP